jgi:hypothetical protein
MHAVLGIRACYTTISHQGNYRPNHTLLKFPVAHSSTSPGLYIILKFYIIPVKDIAIEHKQLNLFCPDYLSMGGLPDESGSWLWSQGTGHGM